MEQLKQKAERGTIIYRLSKLGWTQEEIAKAVGVAQSTVSEKISDLAELLKLVKSLLERGDSIHKVADKLNLDLQLAWSMALEGLDDLQRLELLNQKAEGLIG